jgi:hypothetical protein
MKQLLHGWPGELASLLTGVELQPHAPVYLFLFLAHTLFSVLFALLLSRIHAKYFNTRNVKLTALFFSFNFFVPIMGALGSLITLVYFIKFLNKGSRSEIINVPLPPFQIESILVPAGMGEGGAWSRLRTIGLPRDQRLKALLAVGGTSGSTASHFMQLATGDTDDEIRLLAFNLYGRQEQAIQKVVTATLEELKTTHDPVSTSHLCRTLAFSYWEMIYNSLAQDKLQIFYMEQALRYALQALETGENTPELAILMIRIYLRKRDYLRAEDAIKEAVLLGADHFKIMPYQAEIAFQRRDFTAIKQMVGHNRMVKYRPSIGPVAQFWGNP